MKETDILIIGAGPCGLFTVFEAGLLKLKCHLLDSLPQAGGQLSEIYPKKPIYDIPGYPTVLAQELVDNLMEQIAPFKPEFTLGERAEQIEQMEDKRYKVTTSRGSVIVAPVIAIAGGLGLGYRVKDLGLVEVEYSGDTGDSSIGILGVNALLQF